MAGRRSIDRQQFFRLWKKIARIPSLAAVARILQTPYPTVRDWYNLDRVPGVAMAGLELYVKSKALESKISRARDALRQSRPPEEVLQILEAAEGNPEGAIQNGEREDHGTLFPAVNRPQESSGDP